LAGSEATLERMLDALEIPRAGPWSPKLVINLLSSQGLSNQLNDYWDKGTEAGPRVGRRRIKPPFLNDEEERRAEGRLDSFMSDVIIPLAARTHAIVIVNAFTCNCFLTQSFQRMVALQKMRWGGKPPFWVFAMTNEMFALYGNTSLDAEWRKVRSQCRAWRLREPKIYESFQKMTISFMMGQTYDSEQGWSLNGFIHDLDPNVSVLIMNDSVHKTSGKVDSSAFKSLRTALLRFLASSLPSVALQTGSPGFFGLGQGISLVQSKTPLINLDLRERKSVNSPGADRAQLIQGAKDDFDQLRCDLLQRSSNAETGRAPRGLKWKEAGTAKPEMGTEINNEALAAALRERLELSNDDLDTLKLPPLSHNCYIKVDDRYLKPGDGLPLVDNLLHCNIAWFLDVLKGDGDPSTTTFHRRKKRNGRRGHLPLYQAVLQAQSETESGTFDANGKDVVHFATRQQIDEVALFLADRYFQDQFLQSNEAQQTCDSYAEAYINQITTLTNEIRTLLTSPQLIFLNVHSPLEAAEALVRQIVKLDRLPETNALEGLQLLQEAWCEYDMAMHLANRYKTASKLLFALQLAVGWAIVFIGTAEKEFDDKDIAETSNWRHIVFGLTLGATLMVSVDALFNAKARWRLLRSAAGSLESLLFLYRTRVGQFELDPLNADSRQPEEELFSALKQWRSDLVAGGDLQLSSFQKEHPETIFFHEQTPKARRPRAEIQHPNTTTGDQEPPGGSSSTATSAGGAGRGDRKESETSAPSARDVEKALARSPTLATSPQLDDFYSPLTPELYFDIRIKQYLSFYQRRIPQYARDRYVFKAILVLLTTAAAGVSAYGLSVWALVIAAAVSMLTSWTEFADTGRKVERYTRAVVELKNLLSYWKSLTEVEKASPATIYTVVITGESIISDERVAWMSTAQKSSAQKEGEGDEGKGSSNERGKTAKTDLRQTVTANKVHPS
jgi:hypothetical protein